MYSIDGDPMDTEIVVEAAPVEETVAVEGAALDAEQAAAAAETAAAAAQAVVALANTQAAITEAEAARTVAEASIEIEQNEVRVALCETGLAECRALILSMADQISTMQTEILSIRAPSEPSSEVILTEAETEPLVETSQLENEEVENPAPKTRHVRRRLL